MVNRQRACFAWTRPCALSNPYGIGCRKQVYSTVRRYGGIVPPVASREWRFSLEGIKPEDEKPTQNLDDRWQNCMVLPKVDQRMSACKLEPMDNVTT